MTDNVFSLGTYKFKGTRAASALVIDEHVFELHAIHNAYRDSMRNGAGELSSVHSVLELLEEWDRNFEVLQAVADFATTEGLNSERFRGLRRASDSLRPLPPILRPSKILNCAANYSGHLTEMRKYTQSGNDVDPARVYAGDKSASQPYLFLKAPSSLIGAHDDIVTPTAHSQLDWEAELAVVIGRECRRVAAENSLEQIAGYMTFNDVTCRDELFRADRPNFRTDWLSSKSYDSFGPCGPYFVPRAFVSQHAALRLVLKVNGEVKQDGLAGDMIYSPEEQIAYASHRMTLLPGDIFATGTLAGVGQGTGVFLKPGDIVETEILGLGLQRNHVVGPKT